MHLFKTKSTSPLARLKEAYDNTSRANFTYGDHRGANLMAGLESFDNTSVSTFKAFRETLRHELKNILSSNEQFTEDPVSTAEGDVVEDVTEEGLTAATIIAAAAEDPVTYHENAGVVKDIQGTGAVGSSYVGASGSIDQTTDALEAFDTKVMGNYVPASILFNARASKQIPMVEMFYKTMVVTAQNAGLEVLISRPVVQQDVHRTLNYNEREFNQRNLIDATIEHRILESNSVKLIPAFIEDPVEDNTTGHFVDQALVPAYEVVVDGETMRTAPLKVGQALPDIVALSQPPSMRRAGTPDTSDSLDSGIGIDSLYLSAVKGSDTSVIRLPVRELPKARFMKSPEGESQDVILNFTNDAIALTHLTVGVDNAPPAVLDLLRQAGNEDKIIRLYVSAFGRANLQFGSIEITSAKVKVEGVYVNTGDNHQTKLSELEAKPFVDALGTMEVFGYDVDGTRSNKNLHARGLLIDTRENTEKFQILLGQPLSHLQPLSNQLDEASKVDSLIAASRIRISSNGQTKLLNYIETLKILVPNTNRLYRVAEIEGLARHFIRPYFEERDVDLLAAVNSIKSHERAKDVTACIVNEIRRWTYRAIKLSGFAGAVEQLGGGRVRVLIGTDREIVNHIQIDGDPRLVGLNVDYEVQSTDDNRFYDKIILGLTRHGGSVDTVIDPLQFGTHVWVPEFISEAPVDRMGRSTRELTVQTRNRHINNVPVIGVINIKNLGRAVTEYKNLVTEVIKDETTVTPPTGP